MGALGKLFNTKSIPSELFVNNKWVRGGGPGLKLVNPKSGQIATDQSLYSASKNDVDEAVHISRNAFSDGPWSRFTGEQRGLCMNKLADLILAHREELAYLESICSGRPVSQIITEIPRVATVFRYYAGWADKIKGDSYPPDDGFMKIVRHEPLGVCVGITAWNGSLHFFSWKSAPALACGNTIIIKPSEKSPLGTLAVGYLIEEAGFPPGVIQILPGGGDVGAFLSSHMDVDKISFTGSTGTGRRIQNAATASNLKRVTLELGGKSPGIVFDDCDLEKALFWSTLGIVINTGQVCVAQSRLFIQENILDEFLEKLKGRFEAIAGTLGGDPQESSTSYGPLVDEQQYKKVRDYIDQGKKSTATIVTGGEDHTGDGFYVSPVIFLNPPDDSSIYRDEIFGPVLCVKSFKTEEEAIQMANDTDYGLAGSVYTQDVNRALRVSAKIRSGTVGVNCASIFGAPVPLGGFGSSGYGRELGEYALRHYTETKTIWINMA